MKTKSLRAVAIVALLVALGGTSVILRAESSDRVTYATSLTPTETQDQTDALQWLSSATYEFNYALTREDILRGSESVALIRPLEVHGPFFNSSDRKAWNGDATAPVRVYSLIRATTVDVLAGEGPGDEFEMYVIGDAREQYEGDAPPPYPARSGGYTVGQSYIVALHRSSLAFEQGDRDAWSPVGMGLGRWRLLDSSARSSVNDFDSTEAALRRDVEQFAGYAEPIT